MKRINLNTVLAILGGLGVFAPDLAFVAQWLAGSGVGWLGYVARAFGALAILFAAAPRIVPRLRGFLSLFGLATPPGEPAPVAQTKGAIPDDAVPGLKDPDATPTAVNPTGGQPGKAGR